MMIIMSVGVHHHHLLRQRPCLFVYTIQVSREMQQMRGHDYHDDCW